MRLPWQSKDVEMIDTTLEKPVEKPVEKFDPASGRTCVTCKWYKHDLERARYDSPHVCEHPDTRRMVPDAVCGEVRAGNQTTSAVDRRHLYKPFDPFDPYSWLISPVPSTDPCGPAGKLWEHICPPRPPTKKRRK